MANKVHTFAATFILRKDKAKDGLAPLMLRIVVNGKKAELSTKREVPIDKWCGRKKLSGITPEVKTFNRNLEKLANRAHEIYEKLLISNEPISAEIIRNLLTGKSSEANTITLFYLADYHKESMRGVLEPSTFKHYACTVRYLQRFLKKKHKLSDIAIEKIDYKFIIDFESFLRAWKPLDHQKTINNNGIMKHLIRLRKLTNLAIRLDWLKDNPFKNYKTRTDKVERECLSDLELKSIEEKHFEMQRLELVKDVFVFCCYTGLSYVDVNNITFDNITIGMDGERWITFKRQKTKTPFSVPLLPKALEIIEKYRDHPRAKNLNKLLPVFSNQKTNSYLKEIALVCGIKKNLTFHLARHTFATTITLSNGVPIESVSKMLGHTKIATTQIYAKVIEKKLSEDMGKLREKLNPTNLRKAN